MLMSSSFFSFLTGTTWPWWSARWERYPRRGYSRPKGRFMEFISFSTLWGEFAVKSKLFKSIGYSSLGLLIHCALWISLLVQNSIKIITKDLYCSSQEVSVWLIYVSNKISYFCYRCLLKNYVLYWKKTLRNCFLSVIPFWEAKKWVIWVSVDSYLINGTC